MTSTHDFTAGTVAEAAKVNQNFDELGLLGSAEVTANQGTFTAETDLTGLSVAVTISSEFAAAGRKLKITGSAKFASSVGTDIAGLRIKEGSTQLQERRSLAASEYPCHCEVIVTPTAGAHTYKLAALRITGTGNITMYAAAGSTGFIFVEAV